MTKKRKLNKKKEKLCECGVGGAVKIKKKCTRTNIKVDTNKIPLCKSRKKRRKKGFMTQTYDERKKNVQ